MHLPDMGCLIRIFGSMSLCPILNRFCWVRSDHRIEALQMENIVACDVRIERSI